MNLPDEDYRWRMEKAAIKAAIVQCISTFYQNIMRLFKTKK